VLVVVAVVALWPSSPASPPACEVGSSQTPAVSLQSTAPSTNAATYGVGNNLCPAIDFAPASQLLGQPAADAVDNVSRYAYLDDDLVVVFAFGEPAIPFQKTDSRRTLSSIVGRHEKSHRGRNDSAARCASSNIGRPKQRSVDHFLRQAVSATTFDKFGWLLTEQLQLIETHHIALRQFLSCPFAANRPARKPRVLPNGAQGGSRLDISATGTTPTGQLTATCWDGPTLSTF
jgi:hypothetical protein